MPTHSILITHRNRHDHLGLCLWSIRRSARLTGRHDWEVVVADAASDPPLRAHPPAVRVVVDGDHPRLFNKPRLYRLALAAARGEILTFLDADAIVGDRWLEAVDLLAADPRLIRLCYRVRWLTEGQAEELLTTDDRDALVAAWFGNYDLHRLAFEAYGAPETQRPGPGQPHGNSQFSITRRNLGAIRPNPAYAGRGFEDLELNRQIARHFGDRYRAEILTDPPHALFHLKHPYETDWQDRAATLANCRRYKST